MNRKPAASFIKQYLRPQWISICFLTVLLMSGIGLQLINPQVIRFFLDRAQAAGPARELLWAAILFIAISIAQLLANLATNYLTQRIGWAATNGLRKDLALHCLRLDMGFHKQHTPGELIERVDGDITALANFFSQFIIQIVGNAILIIGILFFLFRENVWVGVGLSFYTVMLLAILWLIQPLAVRYWVEARQAAAEQYGFLEERISGAEDIRAAGAEAHMIYRLYQFMRRYLEKYRLAFLIGNLMQNITQLLLAIGIAIGLGLGVYLYLRGQASLGTAYVIVYYIEMLSGPVQKLRMQAEDFQQATASIQRIQELFRRPPAIQDAQLTNVIPGDTKSNAPVRVDFQNVLFQYDGNGKVLEDLSFYIEPGDILGVLGRTGSGKTTLSRLLFRLYDPVRGSIQLDGKDIRWAPLAELRKRVGMVTQDVQLFQATIRDNLTFFNRAIQDQQILEALDHLGLMSWLETTPQGLDSVLLAGGQGLSAGQAQLLAFTRVFLKDPGLVILDEASSRLDPATQNLLERAIDRLFTGRTAIIIAHRLQTVQRADEILILENGCAVEFGSRLTLANEQGSRFASLLRTGMEEALV